MNLKCESNICKWNQNKKCLKNIEEINLTLDGLSKIPSCNLFEESLASKRNYYKIFEVNKTFLIIPKSLYHNPINYRDIIVEEILENNKNLKEINLIFDNLIIMGVNEFNRFALTTYNVDSHSFSEIICSTKDFDKKGEYYKITCDEIRNNKNYGILTKNYIDKINKGENI